MQSTHLLLFQKGLLQLRKTVSSAADVIGAGEGHYEIMKIIRIHSLVGMNLCPLHVRPFKAGERKLELNFR